MPWKERYITGFPMLKVKYPEFSLLQRFSKAVFSYKHILWILPLIVFFAVPALIGSEYYKKQLIRFLGANLHQNTAYTDVHLSILPAPGLEFDNVEVYENFAAALPLIRAERLNIQVSWKTLFLQEIVFNRVNLYGAEFTVYRIENIRHALKDPGKGSISSGNQWNLQTLIDKYPFLKRISYVQLSSLNLYNSRIHYKDLPNRLDYDILLNSASLSKQINGNYELNWNGLFGDSPVSGTAAFTFPAGTSSLSDMSFRILINAENFPASFFRYFTNQFFLADYRNTRISGVVTIFKKPESMLNVQVNTAVSGLYLKRKVAFPVIYLRGSIDYHNPSKYMRINSMDLEWPGNSRVTGYGSMQWLRTFDIDLKLNSPYSDYASVINFLELIRVPYQDNLHAKGLKQYLLSLKKVNYYGHILDEVNTYMTYRRQILEIPVFESQFNGGILSGKARADFSNFSFYSEGEITGSDIYKIIRVYYENPYLTGAVSGQFRMKSNVLNLENFFDYLVMDGNLVIRKGELLGYLNVIRPIAAVGKILNITGPPGKSTAFETLTLDYKIRKKTTQIRNLSMKGVGVSAKGSGLVYFDSRIDMQLTISMGGSVFGQLLKIPVIYDGIIGETMPYVDPIWIMSVSAGGMLTVPATLDPWSGVIVGSMASEYIRDGYNFVKDLFRSEEPDVQNPFTEENENSADPYSDGTEKE